MTTHLEYYSAPQRMAQALALRDLHMEAVAQAAAPPMADASASPFQARPHTPHAILCGDFNLGAAEPKYTAIQQPEGAARLHDAWPLLHGTAVHAPTFRVFDRTYGPEPVACDFVFVSHTLAPHVSQLRVDLQTRASDHQPVHLTLSAPG